MKYTTLPLPKELKANRTLLKKVKNFDLRLKYKEQNTKRQRIVLSVCAGHIRGGHSFH